MLPDLYPNFSFYFNKHIAHLNPDSHTLAEHRDLHHGILNHYQDDKIFHQLPIFKDFILNTIDYFEENETLKNIKRKNFVAHILFEILLDHLCIIQSPQILPKFYEDLYRFHKEIFFDFIEKSIPSSETNVLFLETFDSFIDRKYMNFYTEESNLIKALHSITGRIGQWQYDAMHQQELLKFIQTSKEKYSFNEVDKRMNNE
jgi:hypothetical protein